MERSERQPRVAKPPSWRCCGPREYATSSAILAPATIPIMSSLENYSDIKYVLEAQAGMADGYSSDTGQPMEGPGH